MIWIIPGKKWFWICYIVRNTGWVCVGEPNPGCESNSKDMQTFVKENSFSLLTQTRSFCPHWCYGCPRVHQRIITFSCCQVGSTIISVFGNKFITKTNKKLPNNIWILLRVMLYTYYVCDEMRFSSFICLCQC